MLAFLSIGCSRQAPREVLTIDRSQLTIGPFHLTDQLDQVSHRVTLKNVSDRPVRIVKWETSCSCTVAEESNANLAPGDESTLTMSIRLPDLRRQAKCPTSDLNVACRPVIAVDGQAPKSQSFWTFRIEVIPLLTKGLRFYMGRVIGSDQPKKSFAIKVHDDVELHRVRSISDDLTIHSELIDDRSATVSIQSVAPKVGFGEGKLMVHGRSRSTGADLTTTVPVTWNRVPELEWVIGDRLIDSVMSDGFESGSFDLFSHRSEPFTIESVDVLHDGWLDWNVDGSRINYHWQPMSGKYGTALIAVTCRHRGQLLTLPPALLRMQPLTGGAP